MREWFIYEVGSRIVDWVFADFWPRILAVLLLAPPLYLAKAWLETGTPKRKAQNLQKIAKRLGKQIPKLRPSGKTVGAVLLLGGMGLLLGMVLYGLRLRHAAQGLSWQAEQFYRATCGGMAASRVTGQLVHGVENLAPIYAQYSIRLQQIMLVVGHHELVQKGIIHDIPLHTYKNEAELKLLETRPFNVVPTVFGEDLCAYLSTNPPQIP